MKNIALSLPVSEDCEVLSLCYKKLRAEMEFHPTQGMDKRTGARRGSYCHLWRGFADWDAENEPVKYWCTALIPVLLESTEMKCLTPFLRALAALLPFSLINNRRAGQPFPLSSERADDFPVIAFSSYFFSKPLLNTQPTEPNFIARWTYHPEVKFWWKLNGWPKISRTLDELAW